VIGNEHQLQHHIDNGGMFAVEKQDWMRYLENGEYLRTAEISEEQNYDMIDGRMNNQMPDKTDAKSKASNQKQNERSSVLGRLKEKQKLLVKAAKKDAPEKKAERDMQ
jgi:hypothetical protein